MTRFVRSLYCLVVLAACNPSRPSPALEDGGVVDAGRDTPGDTIDAAPPPPPGTAMETAVGAGRITSAALVLDVQIGGLPGAIDSPSHAVRPAPALP